MLMAIAGIAHAQRASENAVAEASDAFGSTVGREEIGLYTATSARGFSPSQAGNLRIDGLYFDQISQAKPSTRIVRGSSVHVGISAQGFPFPAPTGVVDFHLRTPDGRMGGGGLLGIASYNQAYAEMDFQTPLVTDTLSIGAGAGFSYNNSFKIADRTREWNVGGVALWTPTATLTITPFWGTSKHLEYGEKQHVFIGNDGYPNYRGVDLMPQPWANYGFTASNFGTTARLLLADDWKIDAGVFRSQSDSDYNFDPFLADVDSEGRGRYSITAAPPRSNRATSGELRLSKRIDTDSVRNTFYASVKGRDRSGTSGGTATLDVGPATTTVIPLIARPAFPTGTATLVEARQVTPGLAYDGVWRNVGQLSVGVQKSYYERTITAPNAPSIQGKSEPWLYNAGAAVFLSRKLVAYASYTRGFEEIGTAPLNAANRDEAVPAQLTEQADAGIKYELMPKLTLVVGVFEIKKPYFDVDQANIFRNVGTTSNRGVELSLAGELTRAFTLVAGVTLIDPTVSFDDGSGVATKRDAIGPLPGLIRANLQYRVAQVEGLTLDAKIENTSKRYARYDSIELPAVTTLDIGARYNTRILGRAMTLRLQGQNLTNEFGLTPAASGQLQPFDGRRYDLSLAFDI